MPDETIASSLFPRTNWAELSQAAGADEARLDSLIRLYLGAIAGVSGGDLSVAQGSG